MKRSSVRKLVVILGLLLVVAGCQKGEREPEALVVSGTSVLAPLLQDIGQRFTESHPTVRIDVDFTQADRAVSDTRQGLADVGVICRPLKPGEAGLQVFPLGRDGVAVIVHKSNPLHSLTDKQLHSLFTRTFTNWREVGGGDDPVVVIHEAESELLRSVFLEHFNILPRQVPPGPSVATSIQAVQAVASQPRSISYASLGVASTAMQEGQPIRLLPLAGIAATPENVRNGSYPLIRPLLLLTRGTPQGMVGALVDYARSNQVDDLIEKYGFAPARP
jgi:phosphate transport system substrate-binding protein